MADGKFKTSDETNYSQSEIRQLITAGKAFRFVGETISKAYETDEGEYYIEAIGSSDQEDLVGDIMSQKALQAMATGFVGKTVFMNHRTMVPDDVFGSILEATIQKQDGMTLLYFKIVVEKENKSAMKTWRIINGGRVQLGTSVTVLVRSSKPNPSRKGGIIIDDVETIELSIVGVPCNRESRSIAATASKALVLANLLPEEEVMTIDATKKAATATAVEEETPAETPEVTGTEAAPAPETESVEPDTVVDEQPEIPAAEEAEKSAFPKAFAALERFKAMVAEVKEKNAAKAKDELPAVDAKGMFADRVEHPTFYDLWDILWDCYYTLYYRAWNLKYDGVTDFSEVVASWNECLDEFKAAALDSFTFWNATADGEGDDILSLSLEEAQKLESSVKHVAELIEASPANADQLRSVGKSIVEIAAKAGIEFPQAAPAAAVEVEITKTKEFTDMATRAEEAEAKVIELETKAKSLEEDLEVTKAGLAVAVEATNAALRKPLHVERP